MNLYLHGIGPDDGDHEPPITFTLFTAVDPSDPSEINRFGIPRPGAIDRQPMN